MGALAGNRKRHLVLAARRKGAACSCAPLFARFARLGRGIWALSLFVCALTLCASMPSSAWALWDYKGTIDSSWYSADAQEYTLTTGEQLAGLSYLVETGNFFNGKTIRLGADIDISAAEWEPIGNPGASERRFCGTFDGQGHKITGLTIDNEKDNQALFGNIDGAVLKNFQVYGSVICSEGGAGIVSKADNSQLSDLVNYAKVIATGVVTGSEKKKSYNGDAAGVVNSSFAMNPEAVIKYTNLVNYGDISGTAPSGVGGVCGRLVGVEGSLFELSQCYNYGNVYVSTAQNVGGLDDGAGGVLGSTSSHGTFRLLKCGNLGSVLAENLGSVAGLAGSIAGENSVVDGSFNKGDVTNLGVDFNEPTEELPTAGGLVSQFESENGQVTNNYSTGKVSSSTGFSAALIAASSFDMLQIASNNYFLEGSSTGAFNDKTNGESFNSLLSGEALSEQELSERIDASTGEVKPIDMQDYDVVEIEDVAPPETKELPFYDVRIEPHQAMAVALCFVALLSIGVGAELVSYRKRKGAKYA